MIKLRKQTLGIAVPYFLLVLVIIFLSTKQINHMEILILALVNVLLGLIIQTISRTGTFVFSPITVTNAVISFQFVIKAIWLNLGNDVEPPSMVEAMYLVTFFNFVYVTSYYIFLLKRNRSKIKTFNQNANYYRKSGYPYMLMGILIFFISTTIFGGSPLSSFADPLSFRIFFQHGGMYYVELLMDFLIISGMVIALSDYFFTPSKGKLWKVVVAALIGLFIALGSGLRGEVVQISLIPFLVYNLRARKNPSWKLLFIAILTIPFVVIYGQYRDVVRGGGYGLLDGLRVFMNEYTYNQGSTIFLFMHRFDAFDNFARIIDSYTHFTYGKSIIDFLAQPIPRSIWLNKPLTFTSQMTKYFRPDLFAQNIALTFSGFGEAFVNFSYIGIILAGVWMSYVVLKLENVFLKAYKSDFWLLWYVLLYQYPFCVLSSGFINDVGNVQIIIYTCMCYMLFRIQKMHDIKTVMNYKTTGVATKL